MNRRRYDRTEFRQSLEFSAAQRGDGPAASFSGRGIDISSDGVGLVSDSPLREATVVRLSVPVPALGITLPVFAEVAWTGSDADPKRAGLRFLR